MRRFYDGDQILEDVNLALEEALSKHGLQIWDLLGITTVLEAIALPMKLQVQRIAGHDLGVKGVETYFASRISRRVALLQSPVSVIVNPMMEGIAVALQRAKEPLSERRLRLAAYRLVLKEPKVTIKTADQQNSSLSSAFSSARDYLAEGRVISRTEQGLWRLNEPWEMV